MKILIVSFLSINLACAPCFGDDPTLLQKDQPAPYEGLLFSQPKSQELRDRLLERDAFKATNDSLEYSLSLKNDIILNLEGQKSLLLKDNDQLAKNLHDERTANVWTYVIFFGLGCLATGAAFWGAKQVQ